MRPSHAAGFVAMREAPLEQLASLPEQPLAIASLHMPPIRVAGLLLFGFAFPMPFPLLLLLGNVRAYFCVPQVLQQRSAMVALVAHHLFDAFPMPLRFLAPFFGSDQLRYLLARFGQRL